jgi:hypothetical protein
LVRVLGRQVDLPTGVIAIGEVFLVSLPESGEAVFLANDSTAERRSVAGSWRRERPSDVVLDKPSARRDTARASFSVESSTW